MTTGSRKISRRALMRIAALAPAAAFAVSPFAQAELAAIAAKAFASKDKGKDKFVKVVDKLWREFEHGVTLGGGDAQKIGEGVFLAAFDKSGPHVINNFACFPDDGDDTVTSSCAKKCGIYAAMEANGGDITVEIFRNAWEKTKAESIPVICRGKTMFPEPKEPIRIMGFGC